MKDLIQFLNEKKQFIVGDAKPCTIYINQAEREGIVTLSDSRDFNYDVAYKMPNGRVYIKPLTRLTANIILKIDLNHSVNLDGTIVRAFGF